MEVLSALTRFSGNNYLAPILNPRLWLTPHIAQTLQAYIDVAPGEISGLGEVMVINNGFYVQKLHLLHQTCTTGRTDMDPDSIADLMGEMISEGRDPSVLRLWWHSHFKSPVFWSDTDNRTIDEFGGGWMVSLVGNQQRDKLARLDIYSPVRLTLNLEVQVYAPDDPRIMEQVSQEVDEMVQFISSTPKWLIEQFPVSPNYNYLLFKEDISG